MSFRLSVRSYRLPFRAPVRTAHGVWAEREGLLLRSENAQGEVRYGEVAPLPWFGTETLEEARTVCAGLGESVDASVLEHIDPRFGCVRFGVAAACGATELPPRVHQKLAVAGLLPAGRAVLARIDELLEAGYLSFKWKVGAGDPADELGLLDDVLARLPGHVKLRLDANGAWTSRQAARWLERCAERPVEFIEQPVPPSQVDALLGLAQDYPVTLALDEAVANLTDLRRWHERGWKGVYVIKPAIAGAPAELLATLAAMQADAVFSSALETAPGFHAALEVAFRHKGPRVRALGFGVGALFEDDLYNVNLGPLAVPFPLDAKEVERLWNSLPT